MIDEGHDFQPEWLKLASGMVDPETDSVLLLYDDAQSIYNKDKQLDFSLSSVGINARGRTTVLRLNYRNTDEVFGFAQRFASHYLHPLESDEDHIPLLAAQPAGRHGIEPELRRFDDYGREVRTIAHWLQHWHGKRDMVWSGMCIIYRHAAQGRQLYGALQDAGIPCQWLGNKETKRQFNPNADDVKLMTMHSSKGLEFPLVVISGLGFMPGAGQDVQAEAKLLYVAMTRPTEKLLLTYHQETEFTQAICGDKPKPLKAANGSD
jgi:superfamily I DNA/RNA helicase